jgi:hypothetical protein
VQVGYEGRFLSHNFHAFMQNCSMWELYMNAADITKYYSKYHKRLTLRSELWNSTMRHNVLTHAVHLFSESEHT